jgi:hypothetical protein
MPLPRPTTEAYPRCTYCREWIVRVGNGRWVHLFTGVEKCYMSTTKATPGYPRGGPHTVPITVPGRH